jgi:hypothetical protein
MQLENAAKLVVDRFGKGAFEVSTGVVPMVEQRALDRSNEEIISTLMEHIKTQDEYMKRQEEFNQALLQRLDQQQKYIEERMNERDKNLLESIRGTQEIKQQLLQIASAKEEKKGFFARLFNK